MPKTDNKRILKHGQQSTTTNLDQDDIDPILQDMVKGNLIYNRTIESGLSSYVTPKNGDSDIDANNTNNPESMSDINSHEPDVFHTTVTPISKRDERPENLDSTLLQSHCIVSLKTKFLTLKNSVIGKINMITEKLNTLLLFAKNRLNI